MLDYLRKLAFQTSPVYINIGSISREISAYFGNRMKQEGNVARGINTVAF
jgi:hypothetical protein